MTAKKSTPDQADIQRKKPKVMIWNLVFFLSSVFMFSSAVAQVYRFGAEDVLSVSFWQDPKMNIEVRVALDGTIKLDIIGAVLAAGRSAEELQDDIIRSMSRLNSAVSMCLVRVVAYNYNCVYVAGQVGSPGKKAFEEIPDLWTLINEAGGATPMGDLTRVAIVRGGPESGKVEVINVADAVARGRTGKLPKVRRLDTVEIPATPSSLPATQLGGSSDGGKNIVYVIGAVNHPGPITYEVDTDLMELLALAGGPSERANLGKVKLITKNGIVVRTMIINLNQYAEEGQPTPYIVQKEDMFIVPTKKGGFLGIGLPATSAIVGLVTSSIILIDRLSGH